MILSYFHYRSRKCQDLHKFDPVGEEAMPKSPQGGIRYRSLTLAARLEVLPRKRRVLIIIGGPKDPSVERPLLGAKIPFVAVLAGKLAQ
jgi:hypothetical protein